MKLFFGGAIQGLKQRGERSEIYAAILETVRSFGHEVLSEHATGRSFEETAQKLEHSIGPLPPVGIQRNIYVRNKMIEFLERKDLDDIIFEVSVPSLGTGVEIAHAYLRPRLGLKEIPILLVYQHDYWPNNLSAMVRGITPEVAPLLELREYAELDEVKTLVSVFISGL